MREPTSDECGKNQTVESDGDELVFATYEYPQMGGYCARSLVTTGGFGSCFDAAIWHDGEWPFGDDDERGRVPAGLHHCDAFQFIRFGVLVLSKQADLGKSSENRIPEETPGDVVAKLDAVINELTALRDRVRASGVPPEGE